MSRRVRLIEVCDQCFRASCWHGEEMCGDARSAGTVLKTAAELRKINAEPPSYYSRENVERVCGDSIWRTPAALGFSQTSPSQHQGEKP